MFDLNRFDKSKFTNKPHEKKIEKPWGYEILLTPPNLPYTAKIVHVNLGHRLSLQVHDAKQETMTLVSGGANLLIDGKDGEIKKIQMQLRKGYTVRVGQRHRVQAVTDCEILEASTPEIGTTYRLEDDYSRGDETEEIRKEERSKM
ncbi:MAG: cupin [Patescibacteria group bacterium]